MKRIWIVVITAVATAAIVGGGTYYLANKSADKDKSDLQAKLDVLKAARIMTPDQIVSDLLKDSTNYFIPEKGITTGSAVTTGGTSASGASTNNTDSNTGAVASINSATDSSQTVPAAPSSTAQPAIPSAGLENEIDVSEDIYQSISAIFNASAGIRDELSDTSAINLVQKAVASVQSRYPIVYIVGGGNSNYPGYNKIYGVNIFTGKNTVVVSEPEGAFIRSVDFNTKNQGLVYAVAPTQEMYGGAIKYDIKIYYLNKKKLVTVANNKYATSYSKWSEDGKNILVGIEGRGAVLPDDPIAPGSSILFWNADSGVKECPVYETLHGSGLVKPRYTFWATQGESAVSIVESETLPMHLCGEGNNNCSGNALDTIFRPVIINKSDCSWKRVPIKDSTVNPYEGSPQLAPVQIGSKIVSFNYDVFAYRADESNPKYSNLGGFYGWLNLYDLNSKSETNLRASMGEKVVSWIISKDADKVVYVTTGTYPNEDFLKIVDVKSGIVKDLLAPTNPAYFSLVGWNGNENNVLLWSGDGSFYNVNLKTGKLAKITVTK